MIQFEKVCNAEVTDSFLLAQKKTVLDKLKAYLTEVIEAEEYYNTYARCRAEVRRIKGLVTADSAEDWLRGLPLGTEYATYNITVMLLKFAGLSEEDAVNTAVSMQNGTSELKITMSDIDSFYWHSVGSFIAGGK